MAYSTTVFQTLRVCLRGLKLLLGRLSNSPHAKDNLHVFSFLTSAFILFSTFAAIAVSMEVQGPGPASSAAARLLDHLIPVMLSYMGCMFALTIFNTMKPRPLTCWRALLPSTGLFAITALYTAIHLSIDEPQAAGAIVLLIGSLCFLLGAGALCVAVVRDASVFVAKSTRKLYSVGLGTMSAHERLALHAKAKPTKAANEPSAHP